MLYTVNDSLSQIILAESLTDWEVGFEWGEVDIAIWWWVQFLCLLGREVKGNNKGSSWVFTFPVVARTVPANSNWGLWTFDSFDWYKGKCV